LVPRSDGCPLMCMASVSVSGAESPRALYLPLLCKSYERIPRRLPPFPGGNMRFPFPLRTHPCLNVLEGMTLVSFPPIVFYLIVRLHGLAIRVVPSIWFRRPSFPASFPSRSQSNTLPPISSSDFRRCPPRPRSFRRGGFPVNAVVFRWSVLTTEPSLTNRKRRLSFFFVDDPHFCLCDVNSPALGFPIGQVPPYVVLPPSPARPRRYDPGQFLVPSSFFVASFIAGGRRVPVRASR